MNSFTWKMTYPRTTTTFHKSPYSKVWNLDDLCSLKIEFDTLNELSRSWMSCAWDMGKKKQPLLKSHYFVSKACLHREKTHILWISPNIYTRKETILFYILNAMYIKVQVIEGHILWICSLHFIIVKSSI